MRSEPPVLKSFRHAAAKVPAYRQILAEAGVDAASIRTLGDFTSRVPIIDKAMTFGRFSIDELCVDGELGKPGSLLTSSGHSGLFAYGIYQAQDEGEQGLIDDALDQYFQVRSKHSLLINCLPMGVKVPTRACTLAETSVRPDMVTALVKAFAPQYDQTILVGETAFIKLVLERGKSQGIDWPALAVQVVVGEEPIAENARQYLYGLLGAGAGQAAVGRVVSSMGVAELGLNLFFETRPLIALRRTLHDDAALRSAVLGPAVRIVPMLFTYDPARLFVEVLEDGRLVVSTLDDGRRLPLIRYVTGDQARLLAPTQLLEAARVAGLDAGDIGSIPIIAVPGRGQFASAGNVRVYPEEVKEGIYRNARLAELTTGNFRLESGPSRVLIRIQLVPGAVPTDQIAGDFAAAIAPYVTAPIAGHRRTAPPHGQAGADASSSGAPIELRPELYAYFEGGMSLDYERKFDYLGHD